MSDNKFKTMRLIMDTVDFRARQRLPKPTLAEVRAALAELGVNGAERVARRREVKNETDLRVCGPGTVLRTDDGNVVELIDETWLLTGEPDPFKFNDESWPARVLYAPEDEA